MGSQTQQPLTALDKACKKYLGNHFSAQNLQRLSGGASAETWRFELINAQTKECCNAILRRSSIQEASQFSTTVPKNVEALVQKYCGRNNIPVPDIFFCLEDEDDLGEGYAMSCEAGQTIPRKILRDETFAHARPLLAKQCGEILARIHQVDISRLEGSLQDQSPLIQLDQLETLYRSYQQPSAVFELAFRWLKENAPNGSRYTLVHGDFRNGNLVIDDKGIRAVLDWELCHFGDPVEDLGWLCVNAWCFGSDKPVGGFGDMDELLDAYQNETDIQVTKDQVRYWQVFGTLRWGIICMFQLNCYLKGLNKSMELAAIGRRVSETELDLLNLLG